MNRLVVAVHIWVIRVADRVILVDTGVGNGKPRGSERLNMLNSLTLLWLEAAGAGRDQVTDVVMSHLHPDHVGWNTVPEAGEWAPTFPQARYWAPGEDIRHFEAEYLASETKSHNAFGDSVLPVRDAGLLRTYRPGDVVASHLRAHDARGHTPGMCSLWLKHGAFEAVFSADIFTSPAQIYAPDWNTGFCMLLDEAHQTRQDMLQTVTSETLVFPCHFPDQGCGFILRDGADNFQWQPWETAIAT
jgi:glyoxylase-like metal-dependent hydrolase (beta-lactamase superfamily II)